LPAGGIDGIDAAVALVARSLPGHLYRNPALRSDVMKHEMDEPLA